MADQSDVKAAIVGVLAALIYPDGTSSPPAQGVPAQIIPGWPLPALLDQLMTAGIACVWVYARPEVKNVSNYSDDWKTQSITPASITATVSGNTVTIGGSVPSPFTAHNVFVLAGGQAFGYAVQANDSAATIASAIANSVSLVYPGTTSSGPVITVIGPQPSARVGTTGRTIQEVGRLEQMFQIVAAANSPAARDALGSAITPVLMGNSWLSMPDGTVALIKVGAPIDIDADQKTQIYRRDIKVSVEYAVTQVQTTATVEAVNVTNTINTLNGTTRSY